MGKKSVIDWDRLRLDAQHLGLSYRELAERVGCSTSTVGRFLTNPNVVLSYEHFVGMAYACGRLAEHYLPGRRGAKIHLGLTGYGRSGKDTVAEHLVRDYGFVRIGFADKVREGALAIDPYVVTRFYGVVRLKLFVAEVGWEKAKEEDDVRRLLQRLGTDFGREMISPDIWVALAKGAAQKHERVVFTDVRFPNEIEICTHVCRVVRPGYGPVNGHKSEALPDDGSFILHNDGDLDELRQGVEVLWQSL